MIFNDRASEQPEARQARLDTECERIHDPRAREQQVKHPPTCMHIHFPFTGGFNASGTCWFVLA